MHPLGESCGPLTLDESIDLLHNKDKTISELKSDLSNEKEKHSDELEKLQALIHDKDATIKNLEKKLEERPTQKLVDDLKEELKILEAEISEKLSLLETAEKQIAELNTKTDKPDKKWIRRFFSMRVQEAGTSNSKGSSSSYATNKTTPFTTPTEPAIPVVPIVPAQPVVPVGRKLIFLGKENRPVFYLEDLLKASAGVLGRGTFGFAYKAGLDSGVTMVVKLLKEVNVPEFEFRKNVARIGNLEHDNILPLIAYYYSMDEKLLLYDYMVMGSLSAILHGNSDSGQTRLNWETRAKIVLSVSKAISYIHSVGPTFCHGNIKSSNVFLSPTYEVFLSDHGLYSLANMSYHSHGGYIAPEITNKRKMTQDADVYSFGGLMMEILTGQNPYEVMREQGVYLVRLVQLHYKDGRIDEAFDVELKGDQSAKDDMMQLMLLALDCTNIFDRPIMMDVTVKIEKILKKDGRKRVQ